MDNKIIKCIKACSLGCAVIVMIVIFVFSSHNAQVSTDDSKSVIKAIQKVARTLEKNDLSKKDLGKKYSKPKINLKFLNDGFIRRIGHILEYTALSFFLFFAFYDNRRGFLKTSFIALIISLLYAMSDEIHQYFVPGRACEFVDFFKDTIGSILGCLICGLVLVIVTCYFKLKNSTLIEKD